MEDFSASRTTYGNFVIYFTGNEQITRAVLLYIIFPYYVWQQNITSSLFMYGHQTGKCFKILCVVQDIPVRNRPQACV